MGLGVGDSVSAAEVRLELERVLRSRVFERAQRSQRFLGYLVEAALADPPVAVKEYNIAIDVFDRDTTYDPSVDATVRVEASRLRSRLREYYAEEGREDPWIFEVPKGGYNVVLTPRTPAEPVSAPVEIPTAQPQPSSRTRYALLVCGLFLLLIAAVGTAWYSLHPRPSLVTSAPVSLAILPFANRTGDQNLNYVADGLTDDLIRELSQVPALRLIGRTTMFRYRGRVADAEVIAKALHVGTVMTGELRRRPEHTLLAVEITNSADGSVVFDREYITDAGDLRTVQADLQRDILAKLHVESSARNSSRPLQSVSSNSEAYQEFLQADALWRTGAPPAIHEAIRHLQKAVALDPEFDLAWSALAAQHLFLGVFFELPGEQVPLAREFVQRALRLNPSLGEAHGILGLIHLVYDWDVPAAQAEMSTAGAETAAIATLACTAHLISLSGNLRHAEEMLNRMLAYDPESAMLISELGCVNFYRGDYEVALRHYRDAIQVDLQSPLPYWGMGKTLNAQGKYAEALKVLRSFKERSGFEPPLITAEIGYALGSFHQREQALEVAHNLSKSPGSGYIDPYFASIVYLSMNDRDAAFQCLNKALDVRSPFVISILAEPKWRPFHNDPRFAQAVQRILSHKS